MIRRHPRNGARDGSPGPDDTGDPSGTIRSRSPNNPGWDNARRPRRKDSCDESLHSPGSRSEGPSSDVRSVASGPREAGLRDTRAHDSSPEVDHPPAPHRFDGLVGSPACSPAPRGTGSRSGSRTRARPRSRSPPPSPPRGSRHETPSALAVKAHSAKSKTLADVAMDMASKATDALLESRLRAEDDDRNRPRAGATSEKGGGKGREGVGDGRGEQPAMTTKQRAALRTFLRGVSFMARGFARGTAPPRCGAHGDGAPEVTPDRRP